MIICNFVYLLEGTGAEEGITLFAQHYKLQKTLRHLSRESNVGDLPVHLPKVTSMIVTSNAGTCNSRFVKTCCIMF